MATEQSLANPFPLPTTPQVAPPWMEAGDRLTADEFHRKYSQLPNVKKAELIEGVVNMSSPVRASHHGAPHAIVLAWMGYYCSKATGLKLLDNATCRLDADNEPQPDVMLLLPPGLGSTAKIDPEGYVAGAPDLVCEIAASSVSIDLHAKLNAYRRNGVREYLVYRVEDGAIDWFVLQSGRYVPRAPLASGMLQSDLFPGLWLDPAALIAGDLPGLFAAIDAGVTTHEHADFAQRCAAVKA